MGTKDSLKKNKKKKKSNKDSPVESPDLVEYDKKIQESVVKAEKDQVSEKKRKRKKEHIVGNDNADVSTRTGKKMKKVKNAEKSASLSGLSNQVDDEIGNDLNEQNGGSKKDRKKEKGQISLRKGEESLGKGGHQNEVLHISSAVDGSLKRKKGKSKDTKKKKKKKKDQNSSKEVKSLENEGGVGEDDVYHISSGDEDCSKGIKKWISQYRESRPGFTILQQRIDEFITAHEEKLEQERKEREARVAEGGWTVVTHHKGRKKTTEAETGITVGSVAQAVVEDNLAKKKLKQVGLDFYRFQKKEAHRNDIMTLQSKFKEDMKRLQQLRAARKFRPY